jgi:hypothetical protein
MVQHGKGGTQLMQAVPEQPAAAYGAHAHHVPRPEIDALNRYAAQALATSAALMHSAEPLRSKVRLQMSAGPLQLLAECERLGHLDKQAESKKKSLQTIAIVLLVIGVPTLFLFGIGLVFLIPAGIVWYVRSKVAAEDFEDRKLEVIQGTLAKLGPELRLTKPVQVGAEFSYHDQSAPSAQMGGVKAYQHWWLNMKFWLQDGTGVAVDATTGAKVKSKSKRRYTKVKDVARERLTITLVPPSGKSFDEKLTRLPWGKQQFSGLTLKRGFVRPRSAVFEYETAPATRLRAGAGWTGYGLENQLDSRRVVSAIIASYKSVASAARRA